jgi:hypothetical protein
MSVGHPAGRTRGGVSVRSIVAALVVAIASACVLGPAVAEDAAVDEAPGLTAIEVERALGGRLKELEEAYERRLERRRAEPRNGPPFEIPALRRRDADDGAEEGHDGGVR